MGRITTREVTPPQRDIDIELRPGSVIEHTLPNGTPLKLVVYKKRGRARLIIKDAATGVKIQTIRALEQIIVKGET